MKRILILQCLSLLLLIPEASGFGRRSANPTPPSSDSAVQAIPIRGVELAHVTVPAFYLPNGNRVDMNTDLKALVDTEINRSRYFRTVVSQPNNRLVITGGVTSLELDILQFNLRIGWTPAGPIPIVGNPTLSGAVDLKLSNLSMDFKIYDRLTGETYLASYTNERLSNLSFQIRVDIGQIGTSIELLTRTKLADAIRNATADIVRNFENNQRLHYVPWETYVLGVAASASELTIAAGGRSGLKTGFAFSVYSACAPGEMLCFERFLADIKLSSIGQTSSLATPLAAKDSLSNIEAGDRVFVKVLSQERR